jgi:hypothetical protein
MKLYFREHAFAPFLYDFITISRVIIFYYHKAIKCVLIYSEANRTSYSEIINPLILLSEINQLRAPYNVSFNFWISAEKQKHEAM